MLNCVGGPDTTAMTRFLGENAHLVSYGAMSKKPLSLPTSLFIFKNLSAHGYWQHRWYQEHSREEREQLMRTLADLKVSGIVPETPTAPFQLTWLIPRIAVERTRT